MLCRKPWMNGALAIGCGQCLPCRINRGRQWTWRQYMESLCHAENCFVTLTYDDAHLPSTGSLEPEELQLFIKRLRRAVNPLLLRFFAVGEYGEDSERPHYHLSLFGMSGNTVVSYRGKPTIGTEVINACWGKGFVGVAEFNEATAQYTCGYIVKKLRDRNEGKQFAVPEFARMSNRPGIGAPAMVILAGDLASRYMDWSTGDVPSSIRIGSRTIGLGRYCLQKLREAVGFSDGYIQEIRDEKSIETSLELLAVFQDKEGFTFREAHAKAIAQKLLQVEARYKIWQSRHPKRREKL